MRASELIYFLQILIENHGDRECFDSDNNLIEEVTTEDNQRDGFCFIIFSEGDMH